jgi:hypothetical protein
VPIDSQIELAIQKLKIHKSQVIDQIPAEIITVGLEQLAMSYINLLFVFGIRRNFMKRGRS